MKVIPKALLIGWVIFIIVVLSGSYAILYFEVKNDLPQIKNYADSLWWSINVSSAVGDCELYPITPMGRIVSVILMVFGYALFSLNVSAIVVLFHKRIDKRK